MQNHPLWRRGLDYLNNRRIRYSPYRLRVQAAAFVAHLQRQRAERDYPFITAADFKATRTSDCIFIFGSGTSLHDITSPEWAHMAEHNTFGFTLFTYQRFIRVDYHLIRELQLGYELNRPHMDVWIRKFTDEFDTNPFFKETILILQAGRQAMLSNWIIGRRLIAPKHRILSYHISARNENFGEYPPPTKTLEEGVTHGSGTLTDCINIAAVGGWRHIVLVGVDLYGKRYFYDTDYHEKPDQTTATHGTVKTGILENLALWRDVLAARGIKLWVYNPLSLLTQILPIYDDKRLSS